MADSIQDVLQAFARGELVVVTDDDDREGEGDLIVAASHCTAEKMAFIIRHTSGIVCAPITQEDARRLRLDPMVAHNDSAHTTAFTVSIDYKPDGGTGISADERASCCRALANPNGRGLLNIPLDVWDAMAYGYLDRRELRQAFEKHGDSWSLAGHMCMLKQAAREAAEADNGQGHSST